VPHSAGSPAAMTAGKWPRREGWRASRIALSWSLASRTAHCNRRPDDRGIRIASSGPAPIETKSSLNRIVACLMVEEFRGVAIRSIETAFRKRLEGSMMLSDAWLGCHSKRSGARMILNSIAARSVLSSRRRTPRRCRAPRHGELGILARRHGRRRRRRRGCPDACNCRASALRKACGRVFEVGSWHPD
jgi:hypothetical protein